MAGLIIAKMTHSDAQISLFDDGQVLLLKSGGTIRCDYGLLPKMVLWDLLEIAHPIHRQEFISRFSLKGQQVIMAVTRTVRKWTKTSRSQ